MNNPLMLGVILVLGGLAFGLLAYAIVLTRREDERRQREADHPQPAEPHSPSGGPDPETVKSIPSPSPSAPSAPPSRPTPFASSRPTSSLTLLRDEVTGELSLEVAGRAYRSLAELKASPDWPRVTRASQDLVNWLGGEKTGEGRSEEPAPRPQSMVEQINAILERKLAQDPAGPRGLRIMEGSGGVLRVFVGLQSYNLEDAPDPEVRRLIREAVAEWEARR